MSRIFNTTLGYLEKDGKWLMLHRTKKQKDLNAGKWIGIGGKQVAGETILECMKRECSEETGLDWENPVFRGIVLFNYLSDPSEPVESEQMFLFCGGKFSGTLRDCDEGELAWVPIQEVFSLNLWEGDRIFLKFLQEDAPFFIVKLNYFQDTLKDYSFEFPLLPESSTF